MSTRGFGSNRDLSEAFADFLVSVARFLLWAGLLAVLVSLGLLVYTAMVFTGGTPGPEAQAIANIGAFQKILIVGLLGLGVGTTYLLWGEETLGPLQVVFAAALYLSPLYVPMLIGQSGSPVTSSALRSIQIGGTIFGILALGVLVADATVRFRLRAQQGFKADQLRYGKGMKEEQDRQNVFLGKCWQLPFCRKFVRERCPIYHSRRTCWRERVGCMCEEEVIRNAMENRAIPKDEVAAANYIPINNKLTLDQKRERCRQCIIYNEHQKHKYRLLLPSLVVVFGALYVLLRPAMLGTMNAVVERLDAVVGIATFRPANIGSSVEASPIPVPEVLLFCLMVILLAYCLKALEFVVFKLKI
jgi:hypothetical protein